MTRIFTSLAWLALAMMGAALVVGLSIGELNRDASVETLRWATVHRLSGVAAALAVVLVNSIVVTYFIGTSRWCKEVSETYALDPSLVRRSTLLKRRTFPWALLGMLAVVGVIALGGAADPATGRPGNGKLDHAAFDRRDGRFGVRRLDVFRRVEQHRRPTMR